MAGGFFKKWAKRTITRSLYSCGLLPLWVKIRLKDKALVLMYHRVLTDEEIAQPNPQKGITVSSDTFSKQMSYIRKHLKPISLNEFGRHLRDQIPFPKQTCLITFDDGWRDNFLNAYPILKENHIPAAIFLATDFIDTIRRFWQEELTTLLLQIREQMEKDRDFYIKNKNLFENEGIQHILTVGERQFPEEIGDFLNAQKGKDPFEIERSIYSLRKTVTTTEKQQAKEPVFLNWEEIKIMARDGIEFCSHGKSHAILTRIKAGEVTSEVKDSKVILEKELGRKITAFSYPNGNFDTNVLNAVQEQGYQMAFGTEKGYVSIADDPFRIRRINIHEDMTKPIPMFLARITGLW